jgi:CRISPR-associated endonuclease/helicase Cas3
MIDDTQVCAGSTDFASVFKKACTFSPYGYQVRLATTEGLPELLNVPTGLGKTAAVVLAWVWRRIFAEEAIRLHTPRRLVYCLPMRVLVEQTFTNTQEWLAKLGLLGEPGDGKVSVHLLMAGPVNEAWEAHPEANSVIIGTQDMLLSRSLNRGYAVSRYRWPMHFALLNNDCLWVMDETQLMGVGVETSAQLAGLRQMLGIQGNSQSVWMSATLGQAQLETVDHPKPVEGFRFLGLDVDDLEKPEVRQRICARKTVRKLNLALTKDGAKSYPKDLATVVLSEHRKGSLTLVVVNRVARAQQIYEQLLKQGRDETNTALIHSRFRKVERAKQERILFGAGDRIVVATQAVEAGVDVSAETLITELAPWPSLVQRFGRCNRRGEFSEARVFWSDIRVEEHDDFSVPYRPDDLQTASAELERLSDAAPSNLEKVSIAEPHVIRPILRRKDLLDLFDTTPDLCGNDLDVSRYIRDGQDTDVHLFWRHIGGEIPPENTPEPADGELVGVSVSQFQKFLEKKPRVWRWNALDERWDAASHARPGQTYLVHQGAGGYSDQLGWTGNSGDLPSIAPTVGTETPDANDANRETFRSQWVSLAEHLEDVGKQARLLAAQAGLSADREAALINAALWHDVGKAHPCFQQMLLRSGTPPNLETLWAKSALQRGRCERKGFRHELASALAWLQLSPEDIASNIVAYLIAAHHGRVRLSIRSLPTETAPPDARKLFARGIWQGDRLPAVWPGSHEGASELELDLSFMQMGNGPRGESWLARMLALRDAPDIGPFRLAYLETLLRVADWRASKLEKQPQ